MHLSEILALRQVPAAGLYLSLTRRCPLSCDHCSTNSTLLSEEHPEDLFRRCVASFTPASHPEVIVLTGGEPLLRHRLVRELTDRAQSVGTKVVLASGMFFARRPAVPIAIAQAITAVDHLAVSLDRFHERQVPRESVFRVIDNLVDRGQDVSFLVVGLGEKDPYLTDATEAIRRRFNERVPVLVGLVGAIGRAKEWLPDPEPRRRSGGEQIDPLPCDLATWPVVGYDGTVLACCNQHVVDGPAPPHLQLGHTSTDDWATLRQRYLDAPLLRAIRVFGPEYIADRYGNGEVTCDGYCSTCLRLSDKPALVERVNQVAARPVMRVMEDQVAMLQQEAFAARHAPPAFAHLAKLGYGAK